MKSAKEVLSENALLNEAMNSKGIIDFHIDNIDTSWMTKTQKRLFEILKIPENRDNSGADICKLAGYKSRSNWSKAISSKQFLDLVESMGIHVKQNKSVFPHHNEIEYIKSSKEKEEYLRHDLWDMRRLFEKFPRHRDPNDFIVNFTKLCNIYIRQIVKRYFKNMISNWQPITFRNRIEDCTPFFSSMYELFPNINSFTDLDRELHIEPIILNMKCSSKHKKRALKGLKTMFEYLYTNRLVNKSLFGLLNKYDMPIVEDALPRPIPPHIKIQLDGYIENIIVPLLEKEKITPIIEPQYWDLLIIIRNTGRRFEDICHLIAEHEDRSIECLQYDLDGDPMLYLDHRIAKIPKDLRIPLAHLKDSKGNNMVERAILRQKERIKNLSPAPDGYKYLFREIKIDNRRVEKDKIVLDSQGNVVVEIISYSAFKDTMLGKICRKIPLKSIDGSMCKISPHQFRHTVATEMIDAGVDIYAVKEFLGHSSVAMTEKYINVYQQRLKKEFKEKLSNSDATDIKNNLAEQDKLYDNKWVKNKIIGVFELGDGCCEHPYKMPSCHHMACKTCVKKKIYQRHLQAVKDTVESEIIHRDNALRMGLTEKAEEFDKVVRFYTIALDIISKGETFEASKHFYVKGVQ